jgi:hypothetical protein
VFSIGIGSGFSANSIRWQAPVFADMRLYLYEGKVSPYSIARIGYNFSKVNYKGGFGDNSGDVFKVQLINNALSSLKE